MKASPLGHDGSRFQECTITADHLSTRLGVNTSLSGVDLHGGHIDKLRAVTFEIETTIAGVPICEVKCNIDGIPPYVLQGLQDHCSAVVLRHVIAESVCIPGLDD